MVVVFIVFMTKEYKILTKKKLQIRFFGLFLKSYEIQQKSY